MAGLEERRISIADNASGSTKRVGTAIDKEVSSPPLKPNVDELSMKQVKRKIDRAFRGSRPWPLPFKDEKKPKICKFTLREEIPRPRLVTVEEFSQPRVVTIGPFHRQESTSVSDRKKWMIVYFVNYLYHLNLESCLMKIKNRVGNARELYSDLDISQSSSSKDGESFTEMLLLDSYFILFVLTIQIRKRPSGFTLIPIPSNSTRTLMLFRDNTTRFLDIIFNKDEIAPDLLILDNQIPFLVIEELFTELKLEKPLHEYALQFFETIHPRSAQRSIDETSPPEFLHLLDLFHWSRVPEGKYIELTSSSPQQLDSIDHQAGHIPNALACRECAISCEKEKPQQLDSIGWARHTPNVMELRESATMFEKKTSGSSLDITFRRHWFERIIGVLDIPELHIRDYSSLIFHNLIAFEMQPSSRCRCTMAFSTFIRNLLQTEQDVKLLRQRGILASSSMTDSQLIDLFARLSRLTENHQMPSDLCAICHQVQSYHNHPVSRFCGSVILQIGSFRCCGGTGCGIDRSAFDSFWSICAQAFEHIDEFAVGYGRARQHATLPKQLHIFLALQQVPHKYRKGHGAATPA